MTIGSATTNIVYMNTDTNTSTECMANFCDNRPGNRDADYCDKHLDQILDELGYEVDQ